MNVTEKEKAKRVEILAELEKNVALRLQKGEIQKAIEELRDIIDDYKRLGLSYKAEILELTLNQMLMEINHPTTGEEEEPPVIEDVENEQTLVQVLEGRSRKAIRRFIQGKTDEAVVELLDIIEEFHRLNMDERAQAIQEWMYQFLGKKLDYDEETKPLSERLETDPELQEQLLSYRTQKVLKHFIKGDPREAVEEFLQIVNDYKRQGKMGIVETLEIWFNLFITKTYLIPAPTAQSAQIKPPSPSTPPTSSNVLPSPINSTKPNQLIFPASPIPPAKPVSSIPSSPIAKPLPSPPSTKPMMHLASTPEPPVTDVFKEKISKIKSLLKQFEESI